MLAELSQMINQTQSSPRLPQWLLFTWTKDAIGQCLRQLHQCYYRHDGQHDIFFPKTIFFFQELRTKRSNSLLTQPALCSQWRCWRCKECMSWASYFYGSYRRQLWDLSSRNYVLVSPNTLTLKVHSKQPAIWLGGKKKSICELHSFFFLWLCWPLV